MTGTENNGDKENGDKIGESHFLLSEMKRRIVSFVNSFVN